MGSQFQSTVLLWWRTVNDAYRQRLSSDQFPWRRGGSALGLGVCYILVEMPSSLSDRVPAYEEEEEEENKRPACPIGSFDRLNHCNAEWSVRATKWDPN